MNIVKSQLRSLLDKWDGSYAIFITIIIIVSYKKNAKSVFKNLSQAEDSTQEREECRNKFLRGEFQGKV